MNVSRVSTASVYVTLNGIGSHSEVRVSVASSLRVLVSVFAVTRKKLLEETWRSLMNKSRLGFALLVLLVDDIRDAYNGDTSEHPEPPR
jgi:hypothetical protein